MNTPPPEHQAYVVGAECHVFDTKADLFYAQHSWTRRILTLRSLRRSQEAAALRFPRIDSCKELEDTTFFFACASCIGDMSAVRRRALHGADTPASRNLAAFQSHASPPRSASKIGDRQTTRSPRKGHPFILTKPNDPWIFCPSTRENPDEFVFTATSPPQPFPGCTILRTSDGARL